MSKRAVENVLAQRYASPEMVAIWSPEDKIIAERRLWLAVLRAQRDLGVDVPDGALADYEAVIDQVDLASIAARERITRHDVKARIEEFNALAGHEQVHKGMTSRDLTENIEQTQILTSLRLIRDRCVAVLDRLGRPGGGVLRPGDGRPVAQRAGPGDHPRQAVRLRRAGGSAGLPTAFGSAGAVPDARHQGTGGHLAGHARPARLGRGGGDAGIVGGAGGVGDRPTCWTASARSTRGRWTTRWCPRSCSWPPGRRRWPPRSG